MARIGIINDYSEVVVAIGHLITPGHELVQLHYPDGLTLLEALDIPLDAIIGVIFRTPEAVARPVEDFEQDVVGGAMLRRLQTICEFSQTKLIIFGIGVLPSEVPDDIRFDAYLTFPEAIQEVNPLLSGWFGPPSTRKAWS